MTVRERLKECDALIRAASALVTDMEKNATPPELIEELRLELAVRRLELERMERLADFADGNANGDQERGTE